MNIELRPTITVSDAKASELNKGTISETTNNPTIGNADECTAVIMELSKQEYKQNKDIVLISDEPPKIYPSYIDLDSKPFAELLDDVRNGIPLSENNEKRLKADMLEWSKKYYSHMQDFRIDERDDRVKKALELNTWMKQRTLQEMQEKLESEKQESASVLQEVKNAKNAHQTATMRGEAHMIKQTLDYLNEDQTNTSQSKQHPQNNEEKEDEVSQQMSGSLHLEGDTDSHLLDKALTSEQRIAENTTQIENQWETELRKEREYSDLLDKEFDEWITVFESDEFSLREKVDAFEWFMTAAEDHAEKRELEWHRRMYDFRALRELRLMSYSNTKIQDAQKEIATQRRNKEDLLARKNGQDYVLNSTKQRIQEIEKQEQEKTKDTPNHKKEAEQEQKEQETARYEFWV